MSAFTDALRSAAAWLDQHPQAGEPWQLILNVYPVGTDVVKQLGGFRKMEFVSVFCLRRDFGEGVSIDFNWPREAVCEPVVTGRRIIP